MTFYAAVEFLRNASEGAYDAIIVDSSDPIGMANFVLVKVFIRALPFKLMLLSCACNGKVDAYLGFFLINRILVRPLF